MLIGVLALQGDSREHLELLGDLGVTGIPVKSEHDLERVDALIIPGGESTTISKLLVLFDLIEPVREFAKTKPVLGTCAGLILLSDQVSGLLSGQELVGGLPISTERNSYGGQLDSFEAVVDFEDGASEKVAFIRAPRILDTGAAEVIARLGDEVVAVKYGNLVGASFHPELTGAKHLHKLFISIIK